MLAAALVAKGKVLVWVRTRTRLRLRLGQWESDRVSAIATLDKSPEAEPKSGVDTMSSLLFPSFFISRHR